MPILGSRGGGSNRGFGFAGLALLKGSVLVSSGHDVGGTRTMQYMIVEDLSDFAYFGDIAPSIGDCDNSGSSSSTRGVFFSAGSFAQNNGGGYITMRSTGNANFFGYVVARTGGGGANTGGNSSVGTATSTTRSCWAGQTNSSTFPPGTWNSNIDYVDYASLGNAVKFGDLTPYGRIVGGAGSPTRGIYWGRFGNVHGPARNDIDYITIASTGNSTSFGDSQNSRGGGACSSTTRAIGAQQTVAGYVTIASTGNATTFDTIRGFEGAQQGGSVTVGIFRDGNSAMQKCTIASTGSFTTFGTTGQDGGGNMACTNTGGNTV